jgi:voltage-gated potassium channel
MKTELRRFSSRWADWSNLPLAIVGLIYLAAYSAQVILPNTSALQPWLELVTTVIWGLYAADLAVRALGAKRLGSFIRTSWLEVVALLIPFIRVLRVFRVLLALRGLKGLFTNRAQATSAYILLLVPLTWYSGAIAVLDAESSSPDASITNLGQALWWSLATITTVGYGDKYPTTFAGQSVAAVLMLTGIALFSASAGIFVSWIQAEKSTVGETPKR